MRLLDRYLLRELLIPLSYCLGGFLIFSISFDLFAELDDLQKAQFGFLDVVVLYALKIPELLSVILPIALLLALLYALTTHARYNEITAIRAAGISVWRLSAMYLLVGILFSVTLFVIDEFWMPQSQDRMDDLWAEHQSQAEKNRAWRKKLFFYNAADNRTWSIASYNPQTGEMIAPSFVWVLPDGSKREVYASRGEYKDRAWHFYDVDETVTAAETYFPVRSRTNLLTFAEFSETPDLIKSEIKINTMKISDAAKRAQLSLEEISNYFRLHPQLSKVQAAMLKTQWHSRIAWPWTCVIVVLIAVPFSAGHGRRNVFVGVAASIFICFAYFALMRVGLTLGTGGHISGWAAAWLPNILFGTIAIILLLRVR